MDTSPDSIRVVGQADLLDLARLARSTWNNWLKQGLVEEPPNGLYDEEAVVQAVVISLLVPALGLRRATAVWRVARTEIIRDSTAGADVTSLHAVIDLHTWELGIAKGARALFAAVGGHPPFPRGFVVIDLSHVIPEARAAFWTRAAPARALMEDKRRKPKGRRRATKRREK